MRIFQSPSDSFVIAMGRFNIGSRLAFLKLLLLCIATGISMQAYGQQRELPEPGRQLPTKDQAMVLDNIVPGGSKNYNWQSGTVIVEIRSQDSRGGRIDLMLNGKRILKQHKLSPVKRTLPLVLKKGTNQLVIATSKANKADTVNVDLLLTGSVMPYSIKLSCSKQRKDTIVLNRL